MPSQRYNSRKIVRTSDVNAAAGINTNSGPYVGIVKNNVDLLRSGRLQVYIPSIGGPDPDDPRCWISCSYASPFFGHTNLLSTASSANYDQVRQSYGFWMVPPDLGVRVLIIFADGDINLAYWFACIPEPFVNQMVPAVGSRDAGKIDLNTASAGVKSAAAARPETTNYPSSEINVRRPSASGQPGVKLERFYSEKRALHEDAYKRLLAQGLDADSVRGAITSSSQRESPSNVIGFSSPGRPVKDIASRPDAENLIRSGADISQFFVEGKKGRRGGHSLVLDDGDVLGRDMLVRLRTARGHQILLHDTEDLIYISSANGRTWVELSADGQVQIYAADSISLRTQRDFNVHADGDINLNAKKSLNIYAGAAAKIESASIQAKSTGPMNLHSTGALTLKSDGTVGVESAAALGITAGATLSLWSPSIGINSSRGPGGETVPALPKNSLPDTAQAGPVYKSSPAALESINPVVPTHEPYAGHAGPKSASDRAGIVGGG